MIIQLSPEWRVRTAPHNFILEELVEGKKGPVWALSGYYGGLRACLSALPDHLGHSEAVTDLTSYLKAWDQVCQHVARGLSK